MIRWSRRASVEQVEQHEQRAKLGPAAPKAYSEEAIFWRELGQDRTVFPTCALLMALAAFGGTGLGGVAATDAWPWAVVVALAAASAAFVICRPHDATGALRPGTDGPTYPRGIPVAVLAVLYLAPVAVTMARAAPARLPALGACAIGLVLLGLCGLSRWTRWLAGWAVPCVAGALALALVWHSVATAAASPVAVAAFVAGGLAIAVLLRAPSGFGLWPPSVLAGELAFLALWIEVAAGGATRQSEPHLTWGLIPAALTGCFVVGLGEAIATDTFSITLSCSVPAIHLGGLCVVPSGATGALGAHLALATVEFAFVLVILHARWRAWRTAEYAPRALRPVPAVVARLDRGQDIPVESVIVDA